MKHIKTMKRFPQTSCQFEHLHSDDASRPEQRMVTLEMQQLLSTCISKLSGKQAEAFTLTRIEGLDYSQSAAIMGCKEETVRVHLHRALKQLATLINPSFRKGD
jgi:RNA polymerase sigma-70 factor (ECF subfamily)